MRERFAARMRARLEQVAAELKSLGEAAEKAEIELELESVTRIEALRLELESAERKIELFVEVHDDDWEAFKTELERSWQSMRETIRAVSAP